MKFKLNYEQIYFIPLFFNRNIGTKGWGLYCLPPPLFGTRTYLPLSSWMRSSTPASSFFSWSLYSSSLSCPSFADMKRRKNVPHPHPQQPQAHPQAPRVDWVPFGRHIFITPFLWIKIYGFNLLSLKIYLAVLIKYLSIYFNIKVKKFTYFLWDSISLILSRIVLISFCNSFSYFLSDFKLAPFSSFSLNLPVSKHPHVQTSFKICR